MACRRSPVRARLAPPHEGPGIPGPSSFRGAGASVRAMPPRPFAIDVPEAVLDDLRARLAATRWPEPIPGAGWDYGVDVAYLRELCDYWREGYDWRAREARLNAIPGFVCEVDGVDLHFWHVRGNGPAPTPLLLVHGWPGSMVEFLELIGPLTDPAAHGGDPDDAFDVVVPALPGSGSQARHASAAGGSRGSPMPSTG